MPFCSVKPFSSNTKKLSGEIRRGASSIFNTTDLLMNRWLMGLIWSAS
jgi:hypothetical protein